MSDEQVVAGGNRQNVRLSNPRTRRALNMSSTTSIAAAPQPPVPTPAAPKASTGEKPLASLLAGATAGAIEGFVTYPTEYAKTQLQFAAGKGISKVGPRSFDV